MTHDPENEDTEEYDPYPYDENVEYYFKEYEESCYDDSGEYIGPDDSSY